METKEEHVEISKQIEVTGQESAASIAHTKQKDALTALLMRLRDGGIMSPTNISVTAIVQLADADLEAAGYHAVPPAEIRIALEPYTQIELLYVLDDEGKEVAKYPNEEVQSFVKAYSAMYYVKVKAKLPVNFVRELTVFFAKGDGDPAPLIIATADEGKRNRLMFAVAPRVSE